MSLSDAMKNLKFDSRMAEFNLKNGQLTEKEYQDHINKLEDVASNAEKLDLSNEDTQLENQH